MITVIYSYSCRFVIDRADSYQKARHNEVEKGCYAMNERYRYFFCDEDGYVRLESSFEQKIIKGLENEMIKKLAQKFDLPIVVMYEGNSYHMCMRCRKIAIGQDSDILCEDCANKTGHARFTKLNKREERS